LERYRQALTGILFVSITVKCADSRFPLDWAALALPAAAHHGFRALAEATDFDHVRLSFR